MNISLFEKLHADGVITDASMQKIKTASGKELFSLHWELKTILYLGILLLSGGIGILIYKNIDTIGHGAILLFIAVISVGCFIYSFKKSLHFLLEK